MATPPDGQSFDEFHAAHSDRLYKHVSRLVGLYNMGGNNSLASVDDLCQDAWYELCVRWERLDRSRGAAALYSYVYRTAQNDLLQVWEERREFREDATERLPDQPNRWYWPLRRSPKRTGRDQSIAEVIAGLSRSEREVVEAMLVEDAPSWKTVAEMLGKKPSTVRTLWQRARAKLEDRLPSVAWPETAMEGEGGKDDG